MVVSISIRLCAIVCGIACLAAQCQAQSAPDSIALRPSEPVGAQTETKFTFLLFSKANDDNTQRLTAELMSALAERSHRAEWKAVDVTDPANRAIVDRYQISRAPMPLVLCVAPNGVVTGAMAGRVTEKGVDAALVTPTMTRCVKALQAGKIVLVHVRSDDQVPMPEGGQDFLADPAFQNRAASENLVITDPAEARFLRDMELDPAVFSGTTLVVLAPPGVLVGKFPATATAAEIAAKLHAAGKCCNDPNCKHNQQGRKHHDIQ